MSCYRVCFDGKWQGKFGDGEEKIALDWARAIGDTGRIVHVAKTRFLLPMRLVAVFPESQAEEARWLWAVRRHAAGAGGWGAWG